MNNPRVMDVVGFIGKFVTDNFDGPFDQEEILDELLSQGFSSREISDAFKWIERNTLGDPKDTPIGAVLAPQRAPMRVLTVAEQSKISPKAFGQLMSLNERGILDAVLLEEIIERLMKYEPEDITDKEVRRIAALSVFTRVQAEWRDFLHQTNTLLH